MTPTDMETLLESACASMRIDRLSSCRWRVQASTDEAKRQATTALFDSKRVDSGRGGHEYLRQLGLIQHVHALRLGRYRVRIVGPAYAPRGMFSDLRSLEREVTAP